jgi:hypothetical protein
MTEHNFQNHVRKELTKRGYTTFRANVGKVKMMDGRYFDSGLPRGFSDLMVLKSGKIAFVELKSEGGKPSKEQLNFILRMQQMGFAAGIAFSLEDVFEILDSK